MPARIVQQPSNPYARSSYVYDDDRGRERDYSDRVASYSSPRRGSVYDYASAYEDDRRYHSRERGRHVSAEELDRQRRSVSDRDSYGRQSSVRTPERSESSRKSRHHTPHIIEESRPPVSSRGQREAADLAYGPAPSRRDSTSSRRSRSTSRFSRWFGGGSSNRAASPEKPPRRERRSRSEKPSRPASCVACLEETSPSRTADLKCGHRMCNSCLRRLFRMSTTDPQHMPPRCCSQEPIPLRYVEQLFDADFKKIWNRKFSEYTTRNRLYCPSRKCGEWIMPDSIRRENGRKVARCGRCKTKVCGSCGLNYHSSTTCPNDEATNKFLSQAQDEGWKRCYRCQAVVELREGCNHMTCRCGAEFCMKCGVKWKGCNCPWFNHNAMGPDNLDMNIPGHAGQHQQTYSEEMRSRRLQELRDRVVARNMQHDSEYDMMGGIGSITGLGNSAGHHMNESYRRDHGALPSRPPSSFDRGASYLSDVNRARGYGPGLERQNSTRSRSARQPSPVAPPLRYSTGYEDLPLRRGSYGHQRFVDEREFGRAPARSPQRARSERTVPARTSRRYEDEAAIHAPPRGRRASVEPPRSSAMAGLNGKDRGMGRVAEWRGYIEPGVPDGESVIGHV